MKARASLLVAVRDLDSSSRSFLSKAADIARRFDAKLNVLHVFSIPYAGASDDTWGVSQAAVDAVLQDQKRKLAKIVMPIQKSGLDVRSRVVWGYPAANAILREAAKLEPDMLIVKTQRHTRLGRWFLTNTDWELIRHCTCPLWLVKSTKLPQRFAALAAVDPFHANDKPARLDGTILDMAQRLAGKTGRVGVCHAFTAPPKIVSSMTEIAVMPPTAGEIIRYRARARRELDKLLGRRQIARKNQLILEGEPAAR